MKYVIGLLLLASMTASAATLKRTTLACHTKQEFSQAWGEIANQDWHALAEQVASGQCVNLAGGQTVSIVGHAGVLSTTVKIRQRGSDQPLWTDMSFIQLDSNNE